jgi:peptide/nickel transport system substrate-binding protein
MRTIPGRAALVVFLAAALSTFVVASAGAGRQAPVKAGGTLVVGIGNGEPDALDPTLSRTLSGREVFTSICEKLYDLNAKLQIVPQLAAGMPKVSADKLTVTIKLRKGIKFNDGTPFNAQAVKTTLDRDKTLAGSRRANEISLVSSVDAVNPTTVVLHLSQPFAPLTAQLADRAGMIMSPAQLAKLGSKFGTNPVCVGPFEFVDRVAGDHITVKKSPFYYNKKKVHLNQIVYRIIDDPAAMAQNLRSHDIDAADVVAGTQLPALQADKSLRITKTAGIGYDAITINIGNKSGITKPFQTLDTPLAAHAGLREAFEDAIDRTTLVKLIAPGVAAPDCFAISPSSSWRASVKGLPCNVHANVARAKQLVKASGVPTPITVHVLSPNDPISLREAQIIQAEEKAVGFNVVLENAEFVTVLNRADAGNFDVEVGVGWSGRIDPDGNIYQFVTTKGELNDSGYSNPRLDLILNNARKATSLKARMTLYHAAQKLIEQTRPVIFTDHGLRILTVNKNVKGVKEFGDGLIRVAFASK